MSSKSKAGLIAILVLAALLRFVGLGKNPPSLNLDEVAIGYNAYSILKTGRDEYGVRFPLTFRSHDDYKPPLYIYLTVPSLAFFGLTEFAVRFPSAAAGTLTVFTTYFLVKELFEGNKKNRNSQSSAISHQSSVIPVFAALLLAISPWHLQFSRAAFETNVAVFFVTAGLWAFLRGCRTTPKWWFLSAICLALSLFTYQTARVFTPLFGFVLLWVYRSQIRSHWKEAMLGGLLFIVMMLPLIPMITSSAGLMRFRGTSVFQRPGVVEAERDREFFDSQRQDRLSVLLFHNKNIAGLQTVMEGYLKHFQPDVVFLGRKGPPYNYIPNVGLLYALELPFLIVGVFSAWKQGGKVSALLTSWVLLSPLASALTWDIPSSTRTAIVLPALQILTAVGLTGLLQKMAVYGKGVYRLGLLIVSIMFFWAVGYSLHQYLVHAPLEYAEAWQYGYKEAVKYAEAHKGEYERIIVSTNLRQPQNFFAFYSGYDPWTYIFIDGGTVSGGFLESQNRFDRYEFHLIDYAELPKDRNILLIDLYAQAPDEYKNERKLELISLPDGRPYIIITQT